MGVLSLKVRIADKGVVKTMQFDPATLVYDACKIIREKIPDATAGAQPKDYGLFLSDDDPKKGVWMENGRTLEYYLVRPGDLLEYKKKIRTLRVRMLDGTVKTLLVDDSQPVGQLMVVICTRIGITNHDEYSMVRELSTDASRAPSMSTLHRKEDTTGSRSGLGTLTLGRNKEKKMDLLRQKLHTDDELNWVDHAKTLREQGIDEAECLLLRRKYFFSDTNVDSRDPVQLNLLYVQCRDGVIDGSHPISKDQAVHLAGLQSQIQFGDLQESKQRGGWLDLREFLPKEYCKGKEVEKRIMQIYKECGGMTELDAKVRYVHRCRSLKTYGVTFFLVKEKVKGKNKLVPRLLGVNKESVMRVDEKTKDVIKEWPLEQVRRWAASPNTFTLDFGDYQDGYYSVQTADGEKIAQLIGGYIDIILKKKRAKDHLGIEGDEGSTMLEDVVSPAKATLMSHGQIKSGASYPDEGHVAIPGVIRQANGEMPYSQDSMQRAQYGAVGGQIVSAYPPPGQKVQVVETKVRSQRALVGTIESTVKAVEDAERELDKPVELPPLGDDPASVRWRDDLMATKKQNVEDQLAAMGAATAKVVKLTGEVHDRVDNTEVGAAVSTISTNLPEMTRGVKTIAALMPEENRGDDLISATRKLCGAFSDFLNSVNPDHKESAHREDVEDEDEEGAGGAPRFAPRAKPVYAYGEESRPTVLQAAGRVGEYSHAMIQVMDEPADEVKEFQDIVIQLAKSVASSTAQLVLRAKTVSSECDDQQLQDNVIHSATRCAFATSQLVACARVVAPTIDSAACQEQLTDAAKQVASAVDALLKDAEIACQNPQTLGGLQNAARTVSESLRQLLDHIRTGPRQVRVSTRDQQLESIITSTDKMISYSGDGHDMIRQAKILAEATTDLVSHIRGDASHQEDTMGRDKLLGAARGVADATTKMIDAAKDSAASPTAPEPQLRMRMAAEEVKEATQSAGADELRRQAIRRLEAAARQVAASATQAVGSANGCSNSNANAHSQQVMMQTCTETAEVVPRMINSIRHSQSAQTPRDEVLAHSELVHVCSESLGPCQRLVNSSRAAAPNVQDQASQMQLSQTSQSLAEALAELRVALTLATQACSSIELEYAIEVTRGLQSDMSQYQTSLRQRQLAPLPGESSEGSMVQLNQSCRSVGSAMAQMLSAAAAGDAQYTGSSARDAADDLRTLSSGIHGLCATRQDINQENLLGCGERVMANSLRMFEQVKVTLQRPNRDSQEQLATVAKAVSTSLRECLNCLPGQQDIDSAIQAIELLIRNLSISQIPGSARDYGVVQDDMLRRASNLGEATSRLVSAVGQPAPVLREAVNNYLGCYKAFHNCTLEMCYHQKDPQMQQAMIEGLRSVSYESSRLLQNLKASAADPNSATLKQQLTSAAKTVTESINRLIDACMAGAPWQNECDNALRLIQAMRHLLENPIHPVNDLTYFECLDMVTDRSKSLGDGMTGIAHYIKQSDMQQFSVCVRQVAESVCGLAEGAAQAAYLVGVSDPSSTPGTAGLVDTYKFERSAQSVREACERIRAAHYTKHQVLDDATSIAKHTSTLANVCRDASSRTSNTAAKRHFIDCARDLAQTTANLIGAVKKLEQNFSDENKAECSRHAGDLLSPLDSLSAFVRSPEFASVPAKISENGRRAQAPIIDAGQGMLDGSCQMIMTAKNLAAQPKNPPIWQQLADNSKVVSDSIKRLCAAIRDKAPGQLECDQAIEHVNQLIKQVDQTALAAASQSLQPRTDKSEQGFYEQTATSSTQVLERIDGLCWVAKREAENVGHRTKDVMQYYRALVDGCVGAASRSYNSKQQMAFLDQCKTVCECTLQLLYAAKDSGGNPKATEYHTHIDESSTALKDALAELHQSIQVAASQSGVVSSLIESLSRSIARTDEPLQHGMSQADYVECQTRMVRICKDLGQIINEMINKSYADPNALGPLALELSRQYGRLADDCRLICASTTDAQVAQRIRVAVQELGSACIDLVKRAGARRSNPDDSYAHNELTQSAEVCKSKLAAVLAALHAGSRGTQACINAASTVSGIIGDLDTTIMFATAGTLNPEKSDDQFADHREAILKTAKALVEDTKALVSGAASSQEQLAVAAQNAVRTIVNLSDVVKSGAAALHSKNSEAQVLVIHAVKDVGQALAQLIVATKNASGKSYSDPAMGALRDAAKVMVTNVMSLLKTVKTVEDEHQRGNRALEAAIDSIGQEIKHYDASEAPPKTLPPEELLRVGKPITDATAKAVAAGQSKSQDDVIACANFARKAVSDLLGITKACAFAAENADARYRCLDAGRDVALKVKDLLQAVQLAVLKPGDESRQLLLQVSRFIAQSVHELVMQGETLKGSDWADPSDAAVIAENELLGAANSIEAAAKKLSSLKPRLRPKQADESLNFDEQILEAAKSIASAVQALVRAASAAQRELVNQGRLEARPQLRTEDYQWSEGLISAARTVAAAVHSLCEAANALVQGHATEEKLISAAKQVASSTAHLLVACKVKSDINSKSMQRLQAAGHAVKTATEHLVRAAKQSIEADDERTLVINQRMVSGIAQVMDAQEQVLRKERELEAARNKLHTIRKAKYTGGGDTSPEPTL